MVKTINGIIVLCLVIFLFILTLHNVDAITGKIGNGRMVLNSEVGETIEKSIRVINDNDVALNISVFTGGNNSELIKIYDTDFILEPGQEKNAKFSIKGVSPGRYDTKIFIQFSSLNDKEAGVGLSSQVVLIVHEANNNNINTMLIILLSLTGTLLVLLILLFYYSKNKKEIGDKGGIDKKSKVNLSERKK